MFAVGCPIDGTATGVSTSLGPRPSELKGKPCLSSRVVTDLIPEPPGGRGSRAAEGRGPTVPVPGVTSAPFPSEDDLLDSDPEIPEKYLSGGR